MQPSLESIRMPTRSLAVLLTLVLVGCDSRPNQWDAFVYPDVNDLTVSEKIAGFKTFELCQSAALDRLRAIHREGAGDYECGFKCAPKPGLGGIEVCKETRK